MGVLHTNRLTQVIKKLFEGKIDLSDSNTNNSSDIESKFLSRGLAAYSLHVLASVDIDVAGQAIVDGLNDNGIDALLFDKTQKLLWFVQSKWIKRGEGEPPTGDMRKFEAGVCDLVNGKLERFNEKINSKKDEIQAALNSSEVKIKVVVAYTGDQFSEHNQRVMDDLMQKINGDFKPEIATYYNFDIKKAYEAIEKTINGNKIDVEVALLNWGQIEEPYQAFYGQINAGDVAQWWIENKSKLFSDNIRSFIGDSEVNTEIARTIKEEPDNFWYFNNGITVLCQKISKQLKTNRTVGFFDCEGISVINGAQTIGSIGSVYEKFPDKVKEAKVFIRFISLEKCSKNFGVRTTKATNTQNEVKNTDFVSLDPEQNRLRTELLLEGKTYHYKRTDEKIIEDEQNCTLKEATIALACASPDVTLATLAKNKIGKLWDDISKEPYTSIFNSTVTATKLWRAIEVLRSVDKEVKYREESTSNVSEITFYNQANRFILHLVFHQIQANFLLEYSFDFEQYKNNVLPHIIEEVIKSTKNILEKNYPTLSPAGFSRFFGTQEKCRELKLAVISKFQRRK